jgi:hypothetical protein
MILIQPGFVQTVMDLNICQRKREKESLNNKIGILTVAFAAERFVGPCMKQFADTDIPHFVVVTDAPWHGKLKDYKTYIEAEKNKNKKDFILGGTYTSDAAQRNAGLRYMARKGIEWAIVVDTDEFWTKKDLNILLGEIDQYGRMVDVITAPYMHVYWKTLDRRIYPDPQSDNPVVVIKTSSSFGWSRLPEHTVRMAQTEAEFHHLSYVRTDEEMRTKMMVSEHNHEWKKDWYERVWKIWKDEETHLHPVVPEQFMKAVVDPVPKEIYDIFDRNSN